MVFREKQSGESSWILPEELVNLLFVLLEMLINLFVVPFLSRLIAPLDSLVWLRP